jgi:hypothetical protein
MVSFDDRLLSLEFGHFTVQPIVSSQVAHHHHHHTNTCYDHHPCEDIRVGAKSAMLLSSYDANARSRSAELRILAVFINQSIHPSTSTHQPNEESVRASIPSTNEWHWCVIDGSQCVTYQQMEDDDENMMMLIPKMLLIMMMLVMEELSYATAPLLLHLHLHLHLHLLLLMIMVDTNMMMHPTVTVLLHEKPTIAAQPKRHMYIKYIHAPSSY